MFESSRIAEALIAELFEGVGLNVDVNEGKSDKMIVIDISNQFFLRSGVTDLLLRSSLVGLRANQPSETPQI